MKFIRFLLVVSICVPTIVNAKLNSVADVQVRQKQAQVHMSRLLEAVKDLTPSEVQEAAQPVVNDKGIMANTAAVATAVIVALAATNQVIVEAAEAPNKKVADDQFDMQFN